MKRLSLTLLTLLCFMGMHAQKVIKNPSQNYSTAPGLSIDQIQLNETSTAVSISYKGRPGASFNIPKKTYICDVNEEDKKLYIQSCDGLNLGKWEKIPENGTFKYTLHFAALGDDVKAIDLREEFGGWHIYDIQLSEIKEASLMPDNMQGVWYNKLGGEIKVCFYAKEAFYKGNRYTYGDVSIDKKGNGTIQLNSDQETLILNIALKKGKAKHIVTDLYPLETYWEEQKGEESNITYRTATTNIKYPRGKEGELLIGESLVEMTPLCKTQKEVVFWGVSENDFPYKNVEFSNDSAIYAGCISGYKPRYGEIEITVYVDNVVAGRQDEYTAKVNAEGLFSIKLPVLYSHVAFVRSKAFSGSVYLEPGKDVFHLIGGKESVFFGELGKINQEFALGDKVISYDYKDMHKKILDMSPTEFVKFQNESMTKDLKKQKELVESAHISPKVEQVLNLNIRYFYHSNKLRYARGYEYAYREKNKIPRKQRKLDVEIPNLSNEDLSFIDAELLNNRLALVCSSYSSFLNHLKYSKAVNPVFVPTCTYVHLAEYLRKYNYPLSNEENVLVDSLLSIAVAGKDASVFFQSIEYRKEIDALQNKYKDLTGIVNGNNRILARNENMQSKFGIKPGFGTDIMTSQDIIRQIVTEYSPVNDKDLGVYNSVVESSEIKDYISQSNEYMLAVVEANKANGISAQLEMPTVEDNTELFDAIMAKYKGKVVYVDFWATWCSPCRSGIKKIAPLKAQMADEDVVFVYLSAASSPQGAYMNMLPEIKGEHYKCTQEQWDALCKQFKVSGIPHYVLVDKNGKVAKNNFRLHNNQAIKQLINKYL